MTHYGRVLDYMERKGSITGAEAYNAFHETRLSAKIFILKRKGHIITDEWETGANIFGEPTRWKRYYLYDPARQDKMDGVKDLC